MATQNSLNKTSGGFTSTAGITVSGGAVSVNSAANAFALSDDASATTVNLATGGAAKVVTLGTTNTTSSLALKYGTNNFSLASATGTLMGALNTGEINYGLTPAFYAYVGTTLTNQTGDGTVVSPVAFNSEIFDQGNNFASNTFTAPVTGRYELIAKMSVGGSIIMTTYLTNIVTSNRSIKIGATTCLLREVGGSSATVVDGGVLVDMDAADTAVISTAVSGSTKTCSILGSATGIQTFFMGKLIC